jgi:phospholipid/cholesterol/gamma-HCH transport system permease protein
LTAIILAGRSGSAFAAEIGTMKVTEQIDALFTLSTDPIKYLVVPRVIAAVLTMPCLVLIGDIIGVMGGYLVSVYKLGFNGITYIRNTVEYLETIDVVSGLVKAAVFGFIIAIMSCYHGYHANKGARGVGTATTDAVVSSSILILLSNYLITELFFS